MNLHRIDLNLFAVFDAIYSAGSLTKAADVLCITQPAVSNSLARLRELFNDPLFVRTGHTMTPTPVAQNMIVPAREALNLMRKSIQASHEFDPRQAVKQFTFASRDLMEVSIIPRLLSLLEDVAPLVTLANYDIPQSKIVSEMANGRLDFYVDSSSFTDQHLKKRRIASDRYVLIARQGHPLLTNGCNLQTFLSLKHISVEHANELEGVDLALDKLGLQRIIGYQSQHFLTVPSALLKTDMVACVPYHLAKHYDVEIYELPVKVNPLEYYLYWHVSVENDKAHQWMRQELFNICQNYQKQLLPED